MRHSDKGTARFRSLAESLCPFSPFFKQQIPASSAPHVASVAVDVDHEDVRSRQLRANWQRLFYEGRMFVSDKSLHSKDFVMTAQADGFEFARRVQAVDELEGALKEFVEFDGPAFLEVMIDENADVFPMVGPGQSYSNMITGPFIPSRTVQETHIQGVGRNSATDMF
jgi:hypothetical protein